MKKVLTILVLGLAVLSFSGCGNCDDQCKAIKKAFNSFPKELQELNKKQYEAGYFTTNSEFAMKLYPMCNKYWWQGIQDVKYYGFVNLKNNCGRIINVKNYGQE